ncbi:helix-turn-helix domain-containing protein [Mobiluncus curtisii]|uniref:helix-turn-helix domain-containing protein n=1 Tax=Mobiluncus curtisii TaxID=2051 RepID=UPI00242A7508|nr:helix-turn-helix domain-containing protein [Mobiluncus curtisii]
MTASDYMTVKQAAQFANLGEWSIRQAMHSSVNPLPYFSTPGGRKHLIDRKDLVAWIEGQKR